MADIAIGDLDFSSMPTEALARLRPLDRVVLSGRYNRGGFMSPRFFPGKGSAQLRLSVVAALVAVLAAMSAAAAANADPPQADPCGAITQAQLAQAFALSSAQKRSSVLRAPGNSAGVIRDRCRAIAWKGGKPSTAKQERQALVAGRLAKLRLETWVKDESQFAETWVQNFPSKVKALTSRARETFVEGPLHGRAINLPKFGAEHSLGFFAQTGGLQKVRAFWWDANRTDIVAINVIEARGKPMIGSLRTVAAQVVPAVG
jgi:hypothetical protein